MKLIVLGAAMACASMLAAAPVAAADASNFDGMYGGVFIGLGSIAYDGQVDTSEIENDFPEEAEIFSGDFVSGLIGGAYAGVNYIHGDFLFGVEASLTVGGIEAYTEDDGGNDYATQSLASLVTLSGRAGYALSEHALLYGAGGVGFLTSSFHAYNDQDDDVDAQDASVLYTLPGVLIAAGFEQIVSDNMMLRLEGSYFLPVGEYAFVADELTDDMDDGDYGSASGVLRLTAGLGRQF
jgi:opacity protein-like surface antigen